MGDPALDHSVHLRQDAYRRRSPEQTVLYQTIAGHWPSFRERAEELGGLPEFVRAEFDEYLRCGVLERGCLHLVCRDCGHSQLVALSCKLRGFCPSCIGRRMADTAVHLEQSVLPRVPIRHWICSFPWGLRALLGYDKRLCSEVVAAFATELSRSLKHRAKQALGLRSVSEAHTGVLVAVQRVDSALRLNVHLHCLALDGVYLHADPSDSTSPLSFHALPTPPHTEVADIARRTADRVARILRAHGKSLAPELADDAPHQMTLDEPGLAACYAAAAQGVGVSGNRAGKQPLRLVTSAERAGQLGNSSRDGDQPIAEVRGINLYAKQLVDGRDRPQLERLCRYITRPPVAQERLTRREDGTLLLAFKKAWKDGTRAIVLEPHDLITRLIAAIPAPRFHMLRYFGVLSSHSKHRSLVVPTPPATDIDQPPEAAGDQLDLALDDADAKPRPRKRWAWLLAHVFRADLEHCPKCGGPMRWLEVATDSTAITRLLADHGLGPRAPPAQAPLSLGQLGLPFVG